MRGHGRTRAQRGDRREFTAVGSTLCSERFGPVTGAGPYCRRRDGVQLARCSLCAARGLDQAILEVDAAAVIAAGTRLSAAKDQCHRPRAATVTPAMSATTNKARHTESR